MDRAQLRKRFDELSLENQTTYSLYVRSTKDLWRQLVRNYLFWYDCQARPEDLEELYEEHQLQVRAKAENMPNFGPFLRIMFGKAVLDDDRERMTFWKWGTSLNALHIEYSENSQRYRSNPEGKLLQFMVDSGGIDGLTKKEDPIVDIYEDEPKKKEIKRAPPKVTTKIRKALQERAKIGLKTAKGIGTASTKAPVRIGEDGLVVLLARREPNGAITIIGSTNDQAVIDGAAERSFSTDITHLTSSLRVIAEVIRSQSYPSNSMPADPLKRAVWFRKMLLDKSAIKTSDLAAAANGGKKVHLMAPSKLLLRGKQGDMILSGSKTDLSVVTWCKPTQNLINQKDQVFLRVMERSLVERMLETGELLLMKAKPEASLKRSSPEQKFSYELSLDNGVTGKPQVLHFYDAKLKAGMLTGFQADFDFDAWKPNWSFRADPLWFGKLREAMIDEWFASFGAGKQLNRPSNTIMRAIVTAKGFGLMFNIHDEEAAPVRKRDTDVTIKRGKATQTTSHLSKDIAPVLYNLADVHCNGSIEVSGNEQALVFSYKNDLGAFKIAVPTAERRKKSAVRKSTAFCEFRYG
jgi:hypothetical protein